jgi:hypothetical protein
MGPLLRIALALSVLAGPALAQTQRLPTTSRSEQQVRDLNASIGQRERNIGAVQQNQFEVNQLRQGIQQQSVSGPPPIGVPTGGRICPPGATGC